MQFNATGETLLHHVVHALLEFWVGHQIVGHLPHLHDSFVAQRHRPMMRTTGLETVQDDKDVSSLVKATMSKEKSYVLEGWVLEHRIHRLHIEARRHPGDAWRHASTAGGTASVSSTPQAQRRQCLITKGTWKQQIAAS